MRILRAHLLGAQAEGGDLFYAANTQAEWGSQIRSYILHLSDGQDHQQIFRSVMHCFWMGPAAHGAAEEYGSK